jgi:hypothetical protein
MALRRLKSACLVAAMAGGLALTSFPAAAQLEDDEPSLFAKALGAAGVIQLPGNEIEYKERAPLVVPPTMTGVQPQAQPQRAPNAWDFNNPGTNVSAGPPEHQALALPPPADPNTVRQRNPNFPVDPEVRAAAKKKKTKRRNFQDDPFYNGNVISRSELDAPGRTAATRPVEPNNAGNYGIFDRLDPRQLNVPTLGIFSRVGPEKDKPVPFTGEPERTSLTQPPAGYQTPSANAPYGVINERYKPKVGTPFDNQYRTPATQ